MAERKKKKEPDAQPEKIPVFATGAQVNQKSAIILFTAAVLLFLLTFIHGNSGWYELHKALRGFFGLPLVLIPFALCYIAIMLDKDETPQKILKRSSHVLMATSFLSGFIEIMFGKGRLQDLPFNEALPILYEEGKALSGGGMVSAIAYPLLLLFGDVGSKILICLLLFVSVMLVSKKTLSEFLYIISTPFRRVYEFFRANREELEYLDELEQEEEDFAVRTEQEAIVMSQRSPRKKRKEDSEPQFLIDIPMEDETLTIQAKPVSEPMPDFDIPLPEEPVNLPKAEPVPVPEEDPELDELIRQATAEKVTEIKEAKKKETKEKDKKKSKEDQKLEAMLEIADEVAMQAEQARSGEHPYQMPRLDFLDTGMTHANDPGAAQELREKADLLQEVLKSFNVDARITNIARGPSVTRYEVQPAAGVKVSRITSLSNDIALNFAVEGVRIEAPIPGKPAVGIEVPNTHRDTVSLRELL